MQEPGNTQRSASCPTCGVLVLWSPQQRWRPFCSERCRLIDLGKWLDESHRISGEESAIDTASPGDEGHYRQL